MQAIVWKEQFSVGVHALDTDHKLMIGLINHLDSAVRAGKGQEQVGHVLNALLDYTVYHFGREEAMLAAVAYPEMAEHCRLHREMRMKVEGIRDAFLGVPNAMLGTDVLDFLKAWFHDHVLLVDKEYQEHLTTRPDAIMAANAAFVAALDPVHGPDGSAFSDLELSFE
jgi:hemerythrin